MRHLLYTCVLAVSCAAFGCASTYVTPAGGVSPSSLTPPNIQTLYDRQPASPFPARLAFARVQSNGYRSYTRDSYGRGSYSVVTTREVETDEQMQRIAALPMVAAVAPLNRMVIPYELNSDVELRQAAAAVKADLLLVYSLDTSFVVEDHEIGPMALITLGFAPNKESHITTTASAAVYDVRTGYIYGLSEATAQKRRLSSNWSQSDAIDAARIEAEREAFNNLVDEFAQTWKGIVEAYAQKPGAM